MAPSHNCEELETAKSYQPSVSPKGLVWLCCRCMGDPEAETTKGHPIERVEKPAEHETDSEIDKATKDIEKLEKISAQKGKEKKEIICRYYQYKKCKFGPKGINCEYGHPNKCFKYMQHGNKRGRGCNKGENCNFFHPPLCKRALKYGKCSTPDCKYHHVKGTDFAPEYNGETDERSGQKMQPTGMSNRMMPKPEIPPRTDIVPYAVQPSYAAAAKRGIRQIEVTPNNLTGNRFVGEQEDAIETNFQDLRQQIQQMQGQMQKILTLYSPPPVVAKQCRCLMSQ